MLAFGRLLLAGRMHSAQSGMRCVLVFTRKMRCLCWCLVGAMVRYLGVEPAADALWLQRP